jgi:hypothetical protein
MKKLITLAAIALTFTFTAVTAQEFSGMDKSPADIASYPSSYKIADKYAKIVYSRPQLNGRSLAELAPAGKVWRTGANESAELTLYSTVKIGDKMIPAGTYSLFTIPGEDTWTLIINSKSNQWGAYSYDESADVARVMGKVSEGSESLEAFSITFDEANNGNLVMGWGTTRVTVPFSVPM